MADDGDSNLSNTSIGLIIVIVVIFLLLIGLLIWWLVTRNSSSSSNVTATVINGKDGQNGQDANANVVITNFYTLVNTPEVYPTDVEIPLNLPGIYTFNVSMISQAGTIATERLTIPPNSPGSNNLINYDFEERNGNLIIHFYDGPPNVEVLLYVTTTESSNLYNDFELPQNNNIVQPVYYPQIQRTGPNRVRQVNVRRGPSRRRYR